MWLHCFTSGNSRPSWDTLKDQLGLLYKRQHVFIRVKQRHVKGQRHPLLYFDYCILFVLIEFFLNYKTDYTQMLLFGGYGGGCPFYMHRGGSVWLQMIAGGALLFRNGTCFNLLLILLYKNTANEDCCYTVKLIESPLLSESFSAGQKENWTRQIIMSLHVVYLMLLPY